MNISSFDVYQYSLELSQPLILRGHQLQEREGLILHLKSDEGAEGFGEIAPLPEFSKETLSEACDQAQLLKANLCGQIIPEKIKKLNGQFDLWLNNSTLKPSVRFGLESAVLNLLASAKNIPLHKLIAKTVHPQVRITGLLSSPKEQLATQAKELIDRGFTELKLKVGEDIDEAIAKVQEINDIICGKALLHLDANQTWNFDAAVAFGKTIGCDSVNYIEEPFEDIQKIPEFFDETLIPVALDESLQHLTFDDIKSISGIDILVLKPTLLGGIEKTWQMINQAENFALDTVISSSFESSLGILILSNLAGTLPHSSIAAGLDTLKWFKTDLMNQPIQIQNGAIHTREQTISSGDINFNFLRKLK